MIKKILMVAGILVSSVVSAYDVVDTSLCYVNRTPVTQGSEVLVQVYAPVTMTSRATFGPLGFSNAVEAASVCDNITRVQDANGRMWNMDESNSQYYNARGFGRELNVDIKACDDTCAGTGLLVYGTDTPGRGELSWREKPVGEVFTVIATSWTKPR